MNFDIFFIYTYLELLDAIQVEMDNNKNNINNLD